MQNIHVKRFTGSDSVHYEGQVEPEDKSWLLFLPKEGEPELFHQVEIPDEGDGHTVGYVSSKFMEK